MASSLNIARSVFRSSRMLYAPSTRAAFAGTRWNATKASVLGLNEGEKSKKPPTGLSAEEWARKQERRAALDARDKLQLNDWTAPVLTYEEVKAKSRQPSLVRVASHYAITSI